MFLLVGAVSALEIDNWISYEDKDGVNDKVITIENIFGLGHTIAKAELITPKLNYVIRGNDRKVMIWNLELYDDSYKNGLEDMEILNLNDKGKEEDKSYHYEYAIYDDVVVNDYEYICNNITRPDGKKSQKCDKKIIGNHIENQIVRWERLDSTDLIKGSITIALVTDVNPEDYYDGIPILFGKRVSRWAEWTDSLNIDLFAYWDFTTVTTMVEDIIVGDQNFTFVGSPVNVSGIIGDALNFTGATSLGNASIIEDNFVEMTWSLWVYPDETVGKLLRQGDSTAGSKDLTSGFTWANNADVDFYVNDDDTNPTINSEKSLPGNWYHIVVTATSGSNITMYVNGTYISTAAISNFIDTENILYGGQSPGGAERFKGIIDEIGYWNRTLTDTEITQLYNSGVGITPNETVSTDELNVTVTLLSPSGDSEVSGYTFNFNATLTPEGSLSNVDLKNATFYVWGSSDNEDNKTTVSVSGNTTQTVELNITINGIDNYKWNIEACIENSTDTICNFDDTNNTFSIVGYSNDGEEFNSSAFETAQEEFNINITTVDTIISVSPVLHYNGTQHSGTSTCNSSGFCQISSTIDIPTINAPEKNINKSFFWEITVFDTSDNTISSNTSQQNQSITAVTFEECGTIDTIAVNFSIVDESNQTEITANFDGYFEYYLGSGTVFKSNFSAPETTASSYTFCIDQNETFKVKSSIDLSKEDELQFRNRHYDFIRELYTNETTNKTLLLVNKTESSEIIIEVKDQGLISLENYLVEVERFFPGLGKHIMVESQTTDEFGQIVGKLIESDVKYKFKFYNENKVLKKTTRDITIVCRSAVCIIPFVIEEISDDFEEFTNLISYTSSLTFDNSTNKFVFSWDDKRGELSTHRLEITRNLFNGSTIIYNGSSTSQLGVLSFAVGDSRASYKGQGFRSVGDDERRIALLNYKVGDLVSIYGLEGLIWTFILLFTLVGVGSFNPTVGVVLYIIGFTALGLLGVIYFNPAIFIATLVLGSIFIWAIRS